MYCKHCGANNPDGVKFCNSCGKPLEEGTSQVVIMQQASVQKEETKQPKNTAALAFGIISGIFAILIGFIGRPSYSPARASRMGSNLPLRSRWRPHKEPPRGGSFS